LIANIGIDYTYDQDMDTMVKIKIDKSTIHGKGVFATSDIKKGSLITQYPNHYEYDRKGGKFMFSQTDMLEIMLTTDGLTYVVDLLKKHKINFEIRDESEFNKGALIVFTDIFNKYSMGELLGNPFKYDNLKYVGHMINDSCLIDIDKPITDKIVMRYTINSLMNQNCILTDIGIIATRDINKGDELLTFYGFNYWLNVNGDREFDIDYKVLKAYEEKRKLQIAKSLKLA
jgi:hypothetical protein